MKTETKNNKRYEYLYPTSFESRNLNYAFYTEYQETAIFLNQNNPGLPEKIQASIGKDLNDAFLKAANSSQSVQNQINYGKRMSDFYRSIQARQFSVYVRYPGLLIGTGYPHKTKQAKGEIQVGTLFDWITGAPYYPGSSVKGVLRSLFKIASGEGVEAAGYRTELLERINSVAPGVYEVLSRNDVIYLRTALFGKDPKDESHISQNGQNTFYDAHIVGFRKNPSGQQKKLIGLDSLAPHKDKITNPIPINMLRILPDVCLTFSMQIHDLQDPDGNVLMTDDQIFTLFKGIILDLGFGAKTRTGYGVVKEIKATDILDKISNTETIPTQTINFPERQNTAIHKDISKSPDSQRKKAFDSQNTSSPIRCPKCGSEIVETMNGFIKCKGRCKMVYGKAFGENLTLDQTAQLLNGYEIKTPHGRYLSVDPNDSYEKFTTYSGQEKYRLKFRLPVRTGQ